MQKNKLDNIIVLKNVNSNIVEEAIVFLKPNIDFKKEKFTNVKQEISNINQNNMVVEEAENIIKYYINQLEENKNLNKNISLNKKIKRMKLVIFMLTLIMLIEFLILK